VWTGLINEPLATAIPFGGFRLIALVSGLDSVGTVFGLLVFYVAIVNAIAYLANPLRGARRLIRAKLTSRFATGTDVRDVSGRARKDRNTALIRLFVQMIGLGIAVNGAQSYLHAYWYIYAAIGLLITWAGGRYIHPAGTTVDQNRAALTGSRRLQVTAMQSVLSVLVISGLAVIVTVRAPSAQVSASAQNHADDIFDIGAAMIILGALGYRFARRWASVEARRLMLRDPRPPVLYLRSFGDDGLKLRTASLGRRSLIERFSPGRFDAFEEVLARHLSRRGPVIAINPPGTGLPPLGAARETLDPANWQATVAGLMERSSLIVFVAPPVRVTQGLRWEMETVSASRKWHKTLVLVPPVSPDRLQDRWQAFLAACGGLWPFTFPLPAEDPRGLLLAFRDNRWLLVTADRRSEWSYGAALQYMLDERHRS